MSARGFLFWEKSKKEKAMTAKELRTMYVSFFRERGHREIPSASLLPENDPTVLFTTA